MEPGHYMDLESQSEVQSARTVGAPEDLLYIPNIRTLSSKRSKSQSQERPTQILEPPKGPTLAQLELKEYISRGWEATGNTWRSSLWTNLDKKFQGTDSKSATGPVWKLAWNFQAPESDSESTDEAGDDVADGDAGNHLVDGADDVGKKEQDHGGKPVDGLLAGSLHPQRDR
ncbi:hypothetical protein C8R43DRAFT_944067 [Mycena crocata]|nr:hypothetical protein C8R43DRAFT_944067 [Mycena crocata]